MMTSIIALCSIVGTIAIYLLSKKIYIWIYTPFTVPIITGTILIILLLVLFQINYEQYMSGAKWIDELLGPAVVALAYPLYKQLDLLKKFAYPILSGVAVGAIVGIVSGIFLSLAVGADKVTIYSLVPKSVTTPVAMDVAEVLGGKAELAAVFVMIAGIGGTVFAPFFLKLFKVDHYIGRGIGLGTAAHGLGTSKALEYGEKEAAVSSVAMTVSAVLTSIASPLLTNLFL